MKQIFLYMMLMLCVFALFSAACQKEDNTTPDIIDYSHLQPAVTPKGTIVSGGIQVSQQIGANGGTVQTTGGEIKIEIPAGALSSNQTISIHEITNTAPLGTGKSFRLTPEGVLFSKPVRITMKYDNSMAAPLTWIVTQKADGSWLGNTKTIVNETAQTVSIETTHFSDWAVGRVMDLRMAPQRAIVGVNQTRKIVITGFAKPATTDADDDDLIPLTPIHPITANHDDDELASLPSLEQLLKLDRYSGMKVTRWAMDGTTAPTQNNKGKLDAQGFSATYIAPSQKPNPNKVQVSATIEAKRLDGGTTTALLFSNITITDGYFLKLTFDNEEYDFSATHATVAFTPNDNEKMLIQAINGTSFMLSFKILDESIDFSGNAKTYTIGDHSMALPYTIELIQNGMDYYNIKYVGIPYTGNCIPDKNSETFVPTSLTMSRTAKMSIPGGGTLYDVQGSFSAEVYYYKADDVPCGPAPSHKLTAEFFLQGFEMDE